MPSSVPGLDVRSQGGRLTVNGTEVPTAAQVAEMAPAQARDGGDKVMAAILGENVRRPSEEPVAAGLPVAAVPVGLAAPAALAPVVRDALPDPGPSPRRAASLAVRVWEGCRTLLGRIFRPVVFGVRILHLHYPHREWSKVVRDMQNDDKIKATTGEHPVGALREILNRTGWTADNPAGLSVSFTPALMEISRKLFGTGWVQRWKEAIGWRTGSGAPRMEMLLTGFHFLYGLLPWGPAAEAIIGWNVQYHEVLMRELWGERAPGQLRVFRPPEVGFSPEMVPGLVKAGVQVVIVDSHHISRSLKGYDSSGMPAVVAPNPADQRNRSPYPMDHATTGKDGRLTKDVLPYSYLPHWLRYVDPADGKEYRVIVFPMAGGPSYIAGYQDFPNEVVQDVARHGVGGRPLVLGLDTDGDNAWGGGYSSYMESMPRLAHWLDTNGHAFGTIQEYLTRYPVPGDDVLDWVEPGAWPNADWGTPQLSRWLWPPIKTQGQKPVFDASAWNFKLQFHALLTLAVHHLLQAQAALQKRDPLWRLDMEKVAKADTDPSAGPLEKAVQQVLRAFDSGHVYYGPEPDFLQIPLLAAKAAVEAARKVLGEDAPALPPTVWGPMRFPWNPGAENRGELYGWRSQVYPGEFDAFGFVHSAAGLKRVELKWRVSTDGRTSPAAEDLRYDAGGWVSSPMTLEDHYKDVEWSGLPAQDRIRELPRLAHAHVKPGPGVLVDYFIEAEDARGRVQRSPIQHVYVGKG